MLKPRLNAAPQLRQGRMATLAPDVMLHIVSNLSMTEVWKLGSLNMHLRALAQSEVRRRIRRYVDAHFGVQGETFMDVLRITGGAVFGASLLEVVYFANDLQDFNLPPAIVVPGDFFDSLHLFIVGLGNFVAFERTWLPQACRSICKGKWLYYLSVSRFLCEVMPLHALFEREKRSH